MIKLIYVHKIHHHIMNFMSRSDEEEDDTCTPGLAWTVDNTKVRSQGLFMS